MLYLFLIVGCLSSLHWTFGNDLQSLASARQVLDLASNFIKEKIDTNTFDPLPVITMSYAQTLDGSIAPANRTRWNLSSRISFRMLHSLRAHNDGVLIGIKTLLADDPQLNVRVQLDGSEIPYATTRPIVIDSHLSILQLHPSQIRTARPIVCTSMKPSHPNYILAQAKMAELGGSLISCAAGDNGRVDLRDVLIRLKAQCGIRSVLVEGGAEIIQSVLQSRLCHQIVLTIKPLFFGGYRSMTRQLDSPTGLTDVAVHQVESDFLMYGKFMTE